MTSSELKTIRDFADKKIVKGISYEKILLRIFDVLDSHPDVKALITEYDGYKDMKVKK